MIAMNVAGFVLIVAGILSVFLQIVRGRPSAIMTTDIIGPKSIVTKTGYPGLLMIVIGASLMALSAYFSQGSN